MIGGVPLHVTPLEVTAEVAPPSGSRVPLSKLCPMDRSHLARGAHAKLHPETRSTGESLAPRVILHGATSKDVMVGEIGVEDPNNLVKPARSGGN